MSKLLVVIAAAIVIGASSASAQIRSINLLEDPSEREIELITTSVAPTSRDVVGGPASVSAY